ncbi:inosine-uridine preferring nucleoside hydrolase-like isoform X2 [Mya arenaria]|uniref:inosine-uridine preferring nucleoside hydrolase-like isoform X2 n=3 Tax=Mya arenaria TaxID=6604 RepID=UPI0022E58311|nr:inosine-uridine preferring nucleoside hydrolase-like isoform X2 [Mya arenaria]
MIYHICSLRGHHNFNVHFMFKGEMKRKLIIDVDTGVDDAQAIMLALSQPEIDVLAITCVSGNVHLDLVCTNTLKVLAACGRLDIPVYRGADRALVGGNFRSTHCHGDDGLGDAETQVDISGFQIQKEHAVDTILRLVNQYPGEITLVTLAPLTNIALALRMDPSLGQKLAAVTIMGGNSQGRGNITLCGEFNFAVDPDAAYTVLHELNVPPTVVPWDANLCETTCYPWDWFDRWIETDTPKGHFMKAFVQTPAQRERETMPFYRSCDLNAMATVIDPEVIAQKQEVFVTVELAGNYTRGMMVVDWNGRLGKSPNIVLAAALDTQRARIHFERMLISSSEHT